MMMRNYCQLTQWMDPALIWICFSRDDLSLFVKDMNE